VSLKAPSDAKKNFGRAQEESAKGDLKAAEAHLQKAVAIYPDYAVAWVKLGELYQRQERMEEAHEAFLHATTADPKYSPALIYLANCAAIQRQWPEVKRVSEQAIKLESGDMAQALYLNAAANFNLGDLEGAEKSALRAEQ